MTTRARCEMQPGDVGGNAVGQAVRLPGEGEAAGCLAHGELGFGQCLMRLPARRLPAG